MSDVIQCSGPCCTALAVPSRQHCPSLGRVPLLALLLRASCKVGGLISSEKEQAKGALSWAGQEEQFFQEISSYKNHLFPQLLCRNTLKGRAD